MVKLGKGAFWTAFGYLAATGFDAIVAGKEKGPNLHVVIAWLLGMLAGLVVLMRRARLDKTDRPSMPKSRTDHSFQKAEVLDS